MVVDLISVRAKPYPDQRRQGHYCDYHEQPK